MADNSSMEFDHYGNKNLNSSSYFSLLLCIFLYFSRSTVAPFAQNRCAVLSKPLRRFITPIGLRDKFFKSKC